MESLLLSSKNTQECAKRAAEVLRAGGVVIYPTDTLYGLGADAFSDQAVDKIYSIKARDVSKPVHCVVPDIEMAEQYGEFSDTARRLAERFLPGPLTLVVPKKSGVEKGIARGIETIGFRIPKNDFCLALANEFDKPYTTTSANISGMPAGSSSNEILEQLEEAAAHVDLIVDAGTLPAAQPSTVVRVRNDDIEILREGAISKTTLRLC